MYRTSFSHALKALVVLLVFSTVMAHADYDQTPVINRFGQVGLVHTQSGKTLGAGRLVVGASGNFSGDTAYLKKVGADSTFAAHLQLYTLYPTVALGLNGFIDFSATLPVYFDRTDTHRDMLGNQNFGGLEGGYGDAELCLKIQYPPYEHSRLFDMAYLGSLSIPTGMKNHGFFYRHAYYDPKDPADTVSNFYTSGDPELDMKMLWTLDLGELNKLTAVLLHLNYGIRFTFNNRLDEVFLLNIGMEYHPTDWLALFSEFSGEARLSSIDRGFRLGDDPLRVTPGFTIKPNNGFFFTVSGDLSISSDKAQLMYKRDGTNLVTRVEPIWRIGGSIGWNGIVFGRDRDKDGIGDRKDRCPDVAEDKDGFEDADGCPDFDNDNDGVPDSVDKCPNVAEDKDGFNDDDGCPDFDNDNDSIADSVDQCPQVAEDNDGFKDADGCPDPDNDDDAVLDSLDKCISVAEDRDGFQDDDGCPDFDNDNDGIADSLDKCPNVAGTREFNGCPPPSKKVEVMKIERGKLVLRGVNFENNKTDLTFDSYAALDSVYESLVQWSEIKIEVSGHTDAVGNAAANLDLSQRRAQEVCNYMVRRGIDSSRLRAVGKGKTEPMADNKTAAGRALNRRVEIKRFD